MLRAMWLELKAHAEKHPNEPFDHERHMPGCMKTARDDPATWAGGGTGCASGSADDGHLVRPPACELAPAVCPARLKSRLLTCLCMQAERVAALQELWDRDDPSPGPHLFRHVAYARIASCKPDVWARCGTAEERAKAVKDPKTLESGTRPAAVIVRAWDAAFKQAFDGLAFHNQRGASGGNPQGYWTLELKSKD